MERLTRLLGPKARGKREDKALTIAATLVGALILARAVDDGKLSDRTLAAIEPGPREGVTRPAKMARKTDLRTLCPSIGPLDWAA